RRGVLIGLVLLLGCGGRSMPANQEPSAVERAYPAVGLVPADAGWIVTSRDAAGLAGGIRSLLAPLESLSGIALAALDQELTQHLGLSPLSPDDLASFGLTG